MSEGAVPVVAGRPRERTSTATVWRRIGRVGAAWIVGVVAPIMSFRGWGGLVMWGPVATRSTLALAGLTLVGSVVGAVTMQRVPAGQLITGAMVSSAVVASFASLAGRLAGAVGAMFWFVAFAIVVGWRPHPRWPCRRGDVTAVVAWPPFIAAAAAWVWWNQALAPVLLAVALAIVAAYDLAPAALGAADGAVRRIAGAGASAGAGAGAAVGRAVTQSAVWTRERARHGRRRLVELAPVRRLGVPRAMVGSVVAAWAGVVCWELWNRRPPAGYLGINDHELHRQSYLALEWWPFSVDAPHFGFHLAARIVGSVAGDSLGPVLVLAGATFATYVAWTVLFAAPDAAGRRLGAAAVALAGALSVLGETPTVLLLVSGLVPADTRFMSVQHFYSPTWVAALPFAVVALVLSSRLLGGDLTAKGPSGRRELWRLAAVVAVGAVVKPAFALCFVPALGLHLVASERARFRDAARVVAPIAVPVAIILVWQTWFMSQADRWTNGFTIDPIGGPVYGWRQCGWAFWLPFAWVGLAAWATRGALFKDRLVRLALWCLAVAVPIFLLVRETGERAQDGNMGVPAQVSVALLLGLCIRAVAVEAADRWERRSHGDRLPAWCWFAGCFAAASLAAGAVALLDVVGVVTVPISWYPYY